jgi:hypothetical protein
MDTDAIEKAMKKKPKKIRPLSLSSGSTMLNLAVSGRSTECFRAGHYYLFVGDSDSGKTFLALTSLAEAANNPAFDDYRLIYDAPEGGALMDIERFFGKKVANRLEAPGPNDTHSELAEDFYYHVDDAVKEGKPFIYILDSMDGLSDTQEADAFENRKKAHRKGKEATGSFNMGKPKLNSMYLRRVISGLKKTNSILIIISQTRDAIGTFGYGDKKTHAGGKALKFYATLQIWSSIREKIKKTVKGKPRQLGILAKVQVKKNRVTGRDRTVMVPVHHSHGIDDLGSCIDYLLEEKHWSGTEGKINAIEFDFKGTKDKLIELVEESEDEVTLRQLAGKVWREIEEASTVKRKRRYE